MSRLNQETSLNTVTANSSTPSHSRGANAGTVIKRTLKPPRVLPRILSNNSSGKPMPLSKTLPNSQVIRAHSRPPTTSSTPHSQHSQTWRFAVASAAINASNITAAPRTPSRAHPVSAHPVSQLPGFNTNTTPKLEKTASLVSKSNNSSSNRQRSRIEERTSTTPTLAASYVAQIQTQAKQMQNSRAKASVPSRTPVNTVVAAKNAMASLDGDQNPKVLRGGGGRRRAQSDASDGHSLLWRSSQDSSHHSGHGRVNDHDRLTLYKHGNITGKMDSTFISHQEEQKLLQSVRNGSLTHQNNRNSEKPEAHTQSGAATYSARPNVGVIEEADREDVSESARQPFNFHGAAECHPVAANMLSRGRTFGGGESDCVHDGDGQGNGCERGYDGGEEDAAYSLHVIHSYITGLALETRAGKSNQGTSTMVTSADDYYISQPRKNADLFDLFSTKSSTAPTNTPQHQVQRHRMCRNKPPHSQPQQLDEALTLTPRYPQLHEADASAGFLNTRSLDDADHGESCGVAAHGRTPIERTKNTCESQDRTAAIGQRGPTGARVVDADKTCNKQRGCGSTQAEMGILGDCAINLPQRDTDNNQRQVLAMARFSSKSEHQRGTLIPKTASIEPEKSGTGSNVFAGLLSPKPLAESWTSHNSESPLLPLSPSSPVEHDMKTSRKQTSDTPKDTRHKEIDPIYSVREVQDNAIRIANPQNRVCIESVPSILSLAPLTSSATGSEDFPINGSLSLRNSSSSPQCASTSSYKPDLHPLQEYENDAVAQHRKTMPSVLEMHDMTKVIHKNGEHEKPPLLGCAASLLSDAEDECSMAYSVMPPHLLQNGSTISDNGAAVDNSSAYAIDETGILHRHGQQQYLDSTDDPPNNLHTLQVCGCKEDSGTRYGTEVGKRDDCPSPVWHWRRRPYADNTCQSSSRHEWSNDHARQMSDLEHKSAEISDTAIASSRCMDARASFSAEFMTRDSSTALSTRRAARREVSQPQPPPYTSPISEISTKSAPSAGFVVSLGHDVKEAWLDSPENICSTPDVKISVPLPRVQEFDNNDPRCDRSHHLSDDYASGSNAICIEEKERQSYPSTTAQTLALQRVAESLATEVSELRQERLRWEAERAAWREAQEFLAKTVEEVADVARKAFSQSNASLSMSSDAVECVRSLERELTAIIGTQSGYGGAENGTVLPYPVGLGSAVSGTNDADLEEKKMR